MLKRQRGQVFILVLILLALGALVITPALNLAFSGLKGRMVQRADLMEYYAADGAQEYSLWLLNDPQFVADLIASGGTDPDLYIILNQVQAEYVITYQASEGAPGDAPLTTDRYKITVVVNPSTVPVPGIYTEFTYSITFKYMYPDVPTEPMTQVQVQVPPRFTYLPGSVSGVAGQEPTRSGSFNQGFTYTWNFSPSVSFEYWEEKAMSFVAYATPSEDTYYVEVNVRTSVPRGSTGPTAPIVVGNPPETGIPKLVLTKTVDPAVIPPGVYTVLTYTITLENLSSQQGIAVQTIEDALPPGFSYADSDTGFLLIDTDGEPDGSMVAGGTRELWEWKFTPTGILTVNAGQTITATFQVIAYVDSSGTYANEVWVTAPGADTGDYSWPTGGVVVPQFDIESSSGGTTLRVVSQVSGGSHNIKSWQVQ